MQLFKSNSLRITLCKTFALTLKFILTEYSLRRSSFHENTGHSLFTQTLCPKHGINWLGENDKLEMNAASSQTV